MGVYKDGYIQVKVGSASVLGIGTAFNGLHEDNLIHIMGNSAFYTVDTVNSATNLTLTHLYQNTEFSQGDTIKGAAYYIIMDYTDRYQLPEITNDSENIADIYTHTIRMIDSHFTYVNDDFTTIPGGLQLGTGNGWSPYDYGGHIGITGGNWYDLDENDNPIPVDPGGDGTGDIPPDGGTPIDPPGTIPPTEDWEESLSCWLKMNETTGAIAYDSAASSVNASVMYYQGDDCWVGTHSRFGHNGKGFRSQSPDIPSWNIGSVIKCQSSYQSTFQDSFTAMGWVSTLGMDTANPQFLFGTRDNDDDHIIELGLGVWTNPLDQVKSQLQFLYKNAIDGQKRYNSNNILLDGYMSPLMHLAVTVTANENIRLYMNGVELEGFPAISDTMVGVTMSNYSNTNPVIVGGRYVDGYDGYGYTLKRGSMMADFRLYNTALTEKQIRSIATQDELAYKRVMHFMYHSRGENDGEYYLLTRTVYNTTTYVRWGKNFDSFYLWNSVNLPDTPVVRNAAMMFKTIYEAGTDTVYSYITAANLNNASTIQVATDVDNFSGVASDIGFHLNGPYATWTNGGELLTPDLSSVVTQVTHRSGWNSGNNILMYIENVVASSINYQRTWRTQEYSTVTWNATFNSPKLYVNYVVATTAIVPDVATLGNTYLLYPINEGVGQVIYNKGYSGYTANFHNAASPLDAWASGIDGNYALQMNATMSMYIDANDNGAMADELYNGPFTITTWLDQDDGATSCTYGGALAWKGGHRPEFTFSNEAGHIVVDYKLTSSPLQDIRWKSENQILSSGQTDWFHLAVAVTGNDYIKVYKDAVLQIANATDTGYIPMSTSNFDASSLLPETYFGAYNHHALGDTDHYQGKIDQVKVFRIRLSQEEIEDIYTVYAPPSASVPIPEFGYALNDGTGTTLSNFGTDGSSGFIQYPSGDEWYAGGYDGTEYCIDCYDTGISTAISMKTDIDSVMRDDFTICFRYYTVWDLEYGQCFFSTVNDALISGPAASFTIAPYYSSSTTRLDIRYNDIYYAQARLKTIDTLALNTWNFICITVSSSGGIKAYYDTVLQTDDGSNTGNMSGISMSTFAGRDDAIFGNYICGPVPPTIQTARSLMDDCRVYPYVLSSEQIAAVFNN